MTYPTNFIRLILLLLVPLVIVHSNPPALPDPDDPLTTLKYLIQLKNYSKDRPYRKFGFTYEKFNLCGLRRREKSAICKTLLSSKKYNFEMLDSKTVYPDLSCKRKTVDVSKVAGITDTKKVLLSMYECPNSYKNEVTHYKGATEDKRFLIPVHLFVAGGCFKNSVALNYQHAGTRPGPVIFHTVFLGLPQQELQDLHFRRRNRIYKKATKLREFNKLKVERIVGGKKKVRRYQYLADDKVLSNFLIKKKPAYTKFMITYNKVNICSMTENEKLYQCRKVFQTKQYKLLVPDPKIGEKLMCKRRNVVLLYSLSRIRSVTMAIVECPRWEEGTNNSFFLGSIHQISGLIAFMQIPPFVEILPDAIITGIKPERLVKNQAPASGNENKLVIQN